MSTAIVKSRQSDNPVQLQGVFSVDELVTRIERMKEVYRRVMQEEVDFGKIPGTDKPTLLQPGAQVLCMTFNVGNRPSSIEDLSLTDDYGHKIEVRYRVTLEFFHQSTMMILGHGIGECSSAEDKYAWRRPAGDNEWEATPEDRRRIKYVKAQGNTAYENKQIRTSPADVANTILKMAKKRALVNGTLDVLAANRIFTQDVEDLPDGMAGATEPTKQQNRTPVEQPQEKAAEAPAEAPDAEGRKKAGYISEAQEKRLYAILKKADVPIEIFKAWLAEKMKVPHMWAIGWKQYDGICKSLEATPQNFRNYKPAPAAAPAQEQAPVQQQGQEPQKEAPKTATKIVVSTSDDDFTSEIKRLAVLAGMSSMEEINSVLFAEFGVPTIAEVKEFDKVAAYFQGIKK